LNYLEFCINIKRIIMLEPIVLINIERCLHSKYQNCMWVEAEEVLGESKIDVFLKKEKYRSYDLQTSWFNFTSHRYL